MAWVWASPSVVDLRERSNDGPGSVRTVWVFADPYRVLGLTPEAELVQVRRAYRRLARLYHPDLGSGGSESLARFRELQRAYHAIMRKPVLQVEPSAGAWWQVAAFPSPEPWRVDGLAVAGIAFELPDPDDLPDERLDDRVRVSYGGEAITLRLTYAPSRWVRAGQIAESVVLLALCAAILPVIAVLTGIEVLLVSDGSVLATWVVALLILLLGYGALTAALLGTGRTAPHPRTVAHRAREAIAARGALPASRR